MERAELNRYAERLGRCEPLADLARVVLSTVDSTNRLGRALVAEYFDADQAIPPVALVAWEQTGGRGRQGRSWASPPGEGAYVSLVLPAGEGEVLELLPLAVAVGLAEAVAELAATPCGIKWPNDLLVRGRKIGGILIEAVHRGGRWAAVAGFGINHGQPEDRLPAEGATSLRVERDGELPGLAATVARLVAGVRAEIDRLEREPDRLAERFATLSVHRHGERLRCRLAEGTLEGRFRGFDEAGRLRIESGGEERLVAAAEVVAS